MKKIVPFLQSLYIPLLVVLLATCTGEKTENKASYGEATQDLIKLVDKNPEVKSMLASSIEQAGQINPDRDTNPVRNLQEYYDFIAYAEKAMPWTLLNKNQNSEIFENIFQSIGYFYFLIDQPLDELEGKNYFHNSLEYAEPFASWVTVFSRSWGKYLDTEDSWNEEYYQAALMDGNFGLQNGWYEDPSHWKTFNQFFARYLSSPDMRPITSPDADSVVVSFADSEPQGVWKIDSGSNLVVKGGVAVKTASLTSISELIGNDSEYSDAFANGTFTHSFLNVNDYHRYHFPMSGTIKEVRIIQGGNPTGGTLGWDAANKRYAFDPSSVGWQCIETRGCVILETEKYGLVALLPIGMATVGSVNFEKNIKPGTLVNKGDMLGYFQFGGSDFIMIFQHQVKFTLDAPKQAGSDSYKHLLMGEKLGYVSIR